MRIQIAVIICCSQYDCQRTLYPRYDENIELNRKISTTKKNAINIPSFSSCTVVGLQLRSDLSGFSADLTDLSGAVQRVQGGLHICSPGKPRFPTARLPQPSGLERQ